MTAAAARPPPATVQGEPEEQGEQGEQGDQGEQGERDTAKGELPAPPLRLCSVCTLAASPNPGGSPRVQGKTASLPTLGGEWSLSPPEQEGGAGDLRSRSSGCRMEQRAGFPGEGVRIGWAKGLWEACPLTPAPHINKWAPFHLRGGRGHPPFLLPELTALISPGAYWWKQEVSLAGSKLAQGVNRRIPI